MSPYLAEFVGTALLLLLGNGVCANVCLAKTKGNATGWLVITLGWGLAVALAVYAVNHVSGAHINPAVTLGLAVVGDFEWALVPGYLVAQILGAIAGACLVWLTYLPHWKETKDEAAIQGCFCTAPAIPNRWGNLVSEIVGTAVLVFGVLSIGTVASALNNGGALEFSTFFRVAAAPMLVGLLVFSIGLSLGGPTGYAINPARDLGPRIAHALLPIAGKGESNWPYAWIPVVGPLLGGVLGGVTHTALGL